MPLAWWLVGAGEGPLRSGAKEGPSLPPRRASRRFAPGPLSALATSRRREVRASTRLQRSPSSPLRSAPARSHGHHPAIRPDAPITAAASVEGLPERCKRQRAVAKRKRGKGVLLSRVEARTSRLREVASADRGPGAQRREARRGEGGAPFPLRSAAAIPEAQAAAIPEVQRPSPKRSGHPRTSVRHAARTARNKKGFPLKTFARKLFDFSGLRRWADATHDESNV